MSSTSGPLLLGIRQLTNPESDVTIIIMRLTSVNHVNIIHHIDVYYITLLVRHICARSISTLSFLVEITLSFVLVAKINVWARKPMTNSRNVIFVDMADLVAKKESPSGY